MIWTREGRCEKSPLCPTFSSPHKMESILSSHIKIFTFIQDRKEMFNILNFLFFLYCLLCLCGNRNGSSMVGVPELRAIEEHSRTPSQAESSWIKKMEWPCRALSQQRARIVVFLGDRNTVMRVFAPTQSISTLLNFRSQTSVPFRLPILWDTKPKRCYHRVPPWSALQCVLQYNLQCFSFKYLAYLLVAIYKPKQVGSPWKHLNSKGVSKPYSIYVPSSQNHIHLRVKGPLETA